MTGYDYRRLLKALEQIEKRLDSLEDMTHFLVRANSRFYGGQRVTFSAYADRRGISARRKRGVRTGTVLQVLIFLGP